jgi:hypothetical protein
MSETVKEGETDRLGETERDTRQRGTPRTTVAWGEVQIEQFIISL